MKNLKSVIRGSSLPNIRIKYGGEVFKFNLFEELSINEKILDKEIKEQPSYYGFLFMLHKKLKTRFETLKQDRIRLEAELFLQYKNEKQPNGRPLNDEMAKASVLIDKEYVRLTNLCIKAKDDEDSIYACVQAFSQRKDLIQTLSSNNRKTVI